MGVGVHFAGLLAVHMVFGVETLDLCRKTGPETGCIKFGDRRSTAATCHKAFPIFLNGIAQRR